MTTCLSQKKSACQVSQQWSLGEVQRTLGRVEERTGYGQRWADHQASLYGFLTLAKSWIHGFQTQNHVCLYFFLFFRF